MVGAREPYNSGDSATGGIGAIITEIIAVLLLQNLQNNLGQTNLK